MTPTQYTCPSCKVSLKTAKPLAPGGAIRCPKCNTTFRIPAAKSAASPAPAPAAAAGARSQPAAAPKKPAPPPPPVEDEDGVDEVEDSRPRGAVKKPVGGPAGRKQRPVEEDEEDLGGRDEPEEMDEEEDDRPRGKKASKGKEAGGKGWLGLRISILILALLSGLATAGVGMKWISDASGAEAQKLRDTIAMMEKNANVFGPAAVQTAKDSLRQLEQVVTAAYFMIAITPIALIGAILALFGMGKTGGGILLATVPVPIFLQPMSVILVFGFLVAGALAFLIGPSRRWKVSTGIAALLYVGGWFGVFFLWGAVLVVAGLALSKSKSTAPTVRTEGVPALTNVLAAAPVTPFGTAEMA